MITLPLPALKRALANLGYTRVKTFGGLIPLAAWDPYGKEGVNAHPSNKPYHGTIRRDGRVVDYCDPPSYPSALVLGVWSFA